MRVALISLCLFFCPVLLAQGTEQEFAVRHFTAADGLPSGRISRLFQDSRGFLWISTNSGIARFDGRNMVQFGLREGMPYAFSAAMDEDSLGNLYVNHNQGISRFNGIGFTSFSPRDIDPDAVCRDLTVLPDQRLLIITRSGLFLLDRDSLTQIKETRGRVFYCVLKTRENRVFIGGQDGVYEWKNNSLSMFSPMGKNEKVIALTEGPDDYLWCGFLHSGIKRLSVREGPGKIEEVVIPPMDEFFISAFITADSENVYIAARHHILVFRDGLYHHSIPLGFDIPSDNVNHVVCDREGNLWVGSMYGVWRYSPSLVHRYPNDKVEGKSVTSIRSAGKDSIVFTDGFYLYAAGRDSLYRVENDKPEQISELNDIALAPDGYYYYGSSLGGLVVHKPDGTYETPEIGDSRFYRCFTLFQHDTDVYMGSYENYYLLRKGKASALGFPELKSQNVLSLYVDGDLHLVGTNERLYGVHRNGKIMNYSGLFENRPVVIQKILRRQDRVYIATNGLGMVVARLVDGILQPDTIINRKSGLPTDYLASAVFDLQGNLWICSQQGISRVGFNGDSGFVVRNLNLNQGVPEAFWEGACLSLDPVTGNIYVGYSEGVIRLNTRARLKDASKPIIHIEAVYQNLPGNQRGDQEEVLYHYPGADKYTVSFARKNLLIKLSAIQLSDGGSLEFWYKLEGESEEWRNAPDDGLLELNNLSPGEYRLVVAAYDRDNQVVSDEKMFRFNVQRPFWMSGWFYFLLTCLVLGLIYAYMRWRINHAFRVQSAQMRINRQLSESQYLAFQARMNPHFIFNSLNAIQFFITNNDKKSSLTYLSKFARLLRQVLDNTKATKVSLKEEVDILNSYLEMESMRFDGRFTYSFRIDPGLKLSQTEIPGMLIQPFVENAIVHGLLHLKNETGWLRISLRADRDYVYCEIEDNGIGRKRSEEINSRRKPNHKSHGMDIARNRLKLLLDEIDPEELIKITDLENPSGTLVHLKIPIL